MKRQLGWLKEAMVALDGGQGAASSLQCLAHCFKDIPPIAAILGVTTLPVAVGGVALVLFLMAVAQRRSDRTDTQKIDELLTSLADGINDLKQNSTAEEVQMWLRRQVDSIPDMPDALKGDLESIKTAIFVEPLKEQAATTASYLSHVISVLEGMAAPQLPPASFFASQDLRRIPPDVERIFDEAFRKEVQEVNTSMRDEVSALYQGLVCPTVELPLPSRARPEHSDRLIFSERTVKELVGRQAEFDELMTFLLTDNPNFQWWLWYGDGGAGKSRLALELCYRAISRGWHAAFLSGNVERLATWQPTRPTLLVLDYASERATEFRDAAAARINSGRDANGHKLRVLLLERDYSAEIGWGRNLEPTEVRRSDQQQARRDPKYLPPLSLDKFLELVNQAHFVTQNKELTQHERDAVKSMSQRDLFARHGLRPLYALMAAEAIANGQPIDLWTERDLLDYILRHEAKIWQQHASTVGQTELHAVFLATLWEGITPSKLAKHVVGKAPGIREFPNEEGCNAVASRLGTDWAVAPLRPDLLGEAFVAARLKDQGCIGAAGCETRVAHESQELLRWSL